MRVCVCGWAEGGQLYGWVADSVTACVEAVQGAHERTSNSSAREAIARMRRECALPAASTVIFCG